MTDDPHGSSLHVEDRHCLERLCEAVRGLVSLGKTGQDIIAIGEAVDAIECLMEGRNVDVDVGLETGFRRGDDSFEEGLFVCFRINEAEIVLDELHTTYSSDVGSDHFTVGYTGRSSDSRFDIDGVERWLEQLREVQAYDDATLAASRDHA